MVEQDYYELLGVQRTADPRRSRPPIASSPRSIIPTGTTAAREREAQFKAINEAYDCLKDPQKRAAYDRFGKAAFQNGGGGDPFGGGAGFESFSDIFSSIFGEFMDRSGARQNPRAARTFATTWNSASKRRSPARKPTSRSRRLAQVRDLPRPRLHQRRRLRAHLRHLRRRWASVRAQQGFFVVERGCPTCRGSGEVIADPCRACEGEGRALKQRKLSVKIPAGVDEGTRIRVAGEGEAGVRNGPGGDLYIFVHMKRHPVYSREGTTLIAECPVTLHDRGARRVDRPAGNRRRRRWRSRFRPESSPASSFVSAAPE